MPPEKPTRFERRSDHVPRNGKPISSSDLEQLKAELTEAIEWTMFKWTNSEWPSDAIYDAILPLVSAALSSVRLQGEQAENALKWIAHLSAVHWAGRAFDPEHMQELNSIAMDGLEGKPLPDFAAAHGSRVVQPATEKGETA